MSTIHFVILYFITHVNSSLFLSVAAAAASSIWVAIVSVRLSQLEASFKRPTRQNHRSREALLHASRQRSQYLIIFNNFTAAKNSTIRLVFRTVFSESLKANGRPIIDACLGYLCRVSNITAVLGKLPQHTGNVNFTTNLSKVSLAHHQYINQWHQYISSANFKSLAHSWKYSILDPKKLRPCLIFRCLRCA